MPTSSCTCTHYSLSAGDEPGTDDVEPEEELSDHAWPDPELRGLLEATPLIKLTALEKQASLLYKVLTDFTQKCSMRFAQKLLPHQAGCTGEAGVHALQGA